MATRAGIEVINASGTLLIDDTYRNLAVIAKGTGLNGSMPAGAVSPALAIRSTSPVAPGIFTKAVSTFGLMMPLGGSATWYLLDVPPAPTSKFGLQVFNGAGKCCFDSALQYGRVVATHSGADQSEWVGTQTLPSGRTYAVVFHRHAYHFQTIYWPAAGYPPNYYRTSLQIEKSCVEIDANVINWSWRIVKPGEEPEEDLNPIFTTTPDPGRFDNSLLASVIDVTGF